MTPSPIALAMLAGMMILSAGCASGGTRRFAGLDRARFYDSSGAFDEQAAKAVYIDFLREAGYPVNETIERKIWASDFGLGRFPEAGVGGIIWWGDQPHNFSSLDAFLLPGQIIPEHWHVRQGDVPEKMEAWLVRFGEMYVYGEGERTPKIRAKPSPADAAHITVKAERILGVGDVAGIARPLEKHWMQAGPDGAIFSEFSTYHTGAAVRFTDPKIKF